MFHPVKNPMHYAGDGKIKCKDAMRSMMSRVYMRPEKAYWWATAFKYLWRWPLKGGRRDLEKCKESIDCILELPDDESETIQLTASERQYINKELLKQEQEAENDCQY